MGGDNPGNLNNLSFEEIHNLPQLFIDIGEALKKSNANVLELKETINELISKEEKLKTKLKYLADEKRNSESELNIMKNLNNDLIKENENYKNSFSTLNGTMRDNLINLQKINEDLQNRLQKDNEENERRVEKLQNEIFSKNNLIQ